MGLSTLSVLSCVSITYCWCSTLISLSTELIVVIVDVAAVVIAVVAAVVAAAAAAGLVRAGRADLVHGGGGRAGVCGVGGGAGADGTRAVPRFSRSESRIAAFPLTTAR